MTAQDFINERRRKNILRYCQDKGLSVMPYGKNAWWITGYGVSVITCDLADVHIKELEPKPVTDR